jgi:2-dehydro-3-deoxyphosphogalactonate aldolase
VNATSSDARFDAAFAACPLVAILRGVKPDEVLAIGQVLVDAGFGIIEVPLNSPDPFDSIARLFARFGDSAVIGAGTVTQLAEVAELARIGASVAISPHTDPEIIAATRSAGLVSVPGALSASEAFAALKAGANALKLFPMEMIGPRGLGALRAVLPKSLRLIAVGGVGAPDFAGLRQAGCAGFGLGGSLYKPGMTPDVVARTAAEAIAAL